MRRYLRVPAEPVVLAVVVFGVCYALTFGITVNRVDEAWFLWVARRVGSGDRLYAEVYNVTTPLAVWITVAVTKVFGTQLIVVRGVVSACFTAEVLLAWSIAKWCGLRRMGRLLLAVALFVTGSRVTHFYGLYSAFAILFALAALRAVLWWHDAAVTNGDAATPVGCGEPRPGGARWPRGHRLTALVALGTAGGLGTGSKPNIGLLTCAASVFALAVWREAPRRSSLPFFARELAVAMGAGVASLAIVMAPVLATGSWNAFVDQVLASKGEYLRVGTSYSSSLDHHLQVITGALDNYSDKYRFVALLVFAPFVAISVLAWAAWRTPSSRRPQLAVFAAFAVAALVSVYPRPGVPHFVAVMPLLIPSLVGVVRTAREAPVDRSAWSRTAMAGLAALLALGVVIVSDDALSGFDSRYRGHDLPHLAGVPLAAQYERVVLRMRRELREHTDGRVFFLTDNAAFFYLTTRTRDPLPYDIPEVSDLGASGQAGVIRRLAAGQAPWVCVRRFPPHRNHPILRPRQVEAWVRTHGAHVERLAACDLYRISPPPPVPSVSAATRPVR